MYPRARLPAAVLCDVGDTLLAEQRFDLRAGIRAVVPDEARVIALALAFEHAAQAAHDGRREVLLADWLIARHAVAAGVRPGAVEDAIWAAVVTLTPRDGAVAFLRRLREDGVPVAAVSNAAFSGRVLGLELDRHGFGGLLRFVVSSADLGWRKPAPAIFREAVGRLGAAPERTWFVGDTLAEDVAGAAAAGLTPIWLRGQGADLQTKVSAVHVRDWPALLHLYEAARHDALNSREHGGSPADLMTEGGAAE